MIIKLFESIIKINLYDKILVNNFDIFKGKSK